MGADLAGLVGVERVRDVGGWQDGGGTIRDGAGWREGPWIVGRPALPPGGSSWWNSQLREQLAFYYIG